MRRIRTIGFIILFLSVVWVLSSCKSDDPTIRSIEINERNLQDSYEIGEFEPESLELFVYYSDGSRIGFYLEQSMIADEDIEKLSVAGVHELTITYENMTTTLSVRIVDSSASSTFFLIYEMGLETGLIDMTYEEWLNSIRGEDGEDGKSAVFRISSGYIQWKHEGGEEWYNLIALDALQGRDGEDGSNGIDGVGVATLSINYKDELIVRLTDDTVINLGQVVGDDGQDGGVPHIGDNGNWWVGETDTGVYAGESQEQDAFTDGLSFVMVSAQGALGYRVSYYEGLSEHVVIPNYVHGVPVISIGSQAFADNDLVTSIEIPDNIREIGRRSFYRASYLSEVLIGEDSQLKHIGEEAFYDNESLQSFDIPKSVSHIGDRAFYNTVSQYNIYLSESVDYVGSQAFYNSATVSASIYVEHEQIPVTWSTSWTNKNELQVHWGIKVKDDYVYNLVSTYAARIVGYLGSQTQIEIPQRIDNIDVTHIGSYAFAFNADIIGFRISDRVTTIEEYALMPMVNLKYVVIPDNVVNFASTSLIYGTENGDYFNLTKLYFEADRPEDCEYDWCESLYSELGVDISYWGVNPASVKVSGNLQYIKYADEIGITGYLEDTEDLVIPSQIEGLDVTRIEKLAFMISSFREITLPETLEEIGKLAFASSYFVEAIIIPDSVQIIAEGAFLGLGEHTMVYIPSSVIIIGLYAFGDVDGIILVERFEKPTGWDSNWQSGTPSDHVYWDVSDFVIEDGFVATVTGNNAKIIKYVGDSVLIIVPEILGGYEVNSIGTMAIRNRSYQYVKVVIPDSIDYIEYRGIYGNYSGYTRIYVETTGRPTTWDSSFQYRAYVYYLPDWSYDEYGVPQN